MKYPVPPAEPNKRRAKGGIRKKGTGNNWAPSNGRKPAEMPRTRRAPKKIAPRKGYGRMV